MQNSPKDHYLKEQRDEFKKIIEEKLEESQNLLSSVNESFVNGKDNGTDDTFLPIQTFDDSSETLTKEQNGKLIDHLQKYISVLTKALERVKTESYGKCRACNHLILSQRLKLVPHATLCASCKEALEKK
jgi:DnaK suppressor protein